MSLGQTIYRLRKKKKLSQGELADLLEVSRQSISKWETDASVPELDKLLRLSEIFGISLDELVRGEPTPSANQTTAAPPPQTVVVTAPSMPPRKIVGTILLCTGGVIFLLLSLLGGFFGGLLFASPFLLCGAICLLFKRRIGLWCAWALYFAIDSYLIYATGASRGAILSPLFAAEGLTLTVLISWMLVLALLALIVCTLVSYRNLRLPLDRRNLLGLVLCAVTALLPFAVGAVFMGLYPLSSGGLRLFAFFTHLFDWLRIAAITVLLVRFLAILRGRRQTVK